MAIKLISLHATIHIIWLSRYAGCNGRWPLSTTPQATGYRALVTSSEYSTLCREHTNSVRGVREHTGSKAFVQLIPHSTASLRWQLRRYELTTRQTQIYRTRQFIISEPPLLKLVQLMALLINVISEHEFNFVSY